MTNRLIRYYGMLDPYGIPTAIGIPVIFLILPLFFYSTYTLHIDHFVKFGGILGGAYWLIIVYLIVDMYRSRKGPWTLRQKLIWWYITITSPIAAFLVGAFYFGVFYPIWRLLAWIYNNSTPSIWLALGIGIFTFAVGTCLFFFRLRARALYGATEVMAGVLVASHRSYSLPNLSTISDTDFLLFLLTAGVYLVVRGLDNIHTGIFKEPRDAAYSRVLTWWQRIDADAPRTEPVKDNMIRKDSSSESDKISIDR